MKAHIGDRLLPDNDPGRAGVVIGLQNADGSPPFIVKWLSDGHIAPGLPRAVRAGGARRRNGGTYR